MLCIAIHGLTSMMDHARIRKEHDFPSRTDEATMPFDLFGPDDRDFRHRPDLTDRLHANRHTGASERVDLNSAVMVPVS